MRVLLVEWQFVLEQPAAIGASESRHETGSAIPVARRPDTGAPWVPVTSLAGSLREHLGTEPALCRALLGPDFAAMSTKGSNSESSGSSALRLLGSEVDLGANTIEVRHRTQHDRRRAAAQAHQLVRSEALPRGTVVTLWGFVRQDHSAVSNLDQAAAELVAATAGARPWAPIIGGGRSIGRGRSSLRSCRWDLLDLDGAEDLGWWLGGLTPARIHTRLTGAHSRSPEPGGPPEPLATWDFSIPDALAVTRGDGTLLRDADGYPIVPGTTWKGVLRSRVEYILRSLGIRACSGGNDGDQCAGCPACTIFGGTGQRTGSVGTGLRSSVMFEDHRVCAEAGAPAPSTVRTHVAIDRFTGGASDRLLFTVEAITSGMVSVTVRATTTRARVPQYAVPLIALAVRDIADGLVGVGHGTTRGYGTLEAREPTGTQVDWDVWTRELRLLRATFPAKDEETHG